VYAQSTPGVRTRQVRNTHVWNSSRRIRQDRLDLGQVVCSLVARRNPSLAQPVECRVQQIGLDDSLDIVHKGGLGRVDVLRPVAVWRVVESDIEGGEAGLGLAGRGFQVQVQCSVA